MAATVVPPRDVMIALVFAVAAAVAMAAALMFKGEGVGDPTL